MLLSSLLHPAIIPVTIHEKLRFMRESLCIKQVEVADRLGISPHTYSDFETGKVKFSQPRLRLLASQYGFTVDEVVESPLPVLIIHYWSTYSKTAVLQQ